MMISAFVFTSCSKDDDIIKTNEEVYNEGVEYLANNAKREGVTVTRADFNTRYCKKATERLLPQQAP